MCKRSKVGHYLTPYTKMNSKWIKDLNVRPETIKLLGEKIGGKLPDTSLGDDFLNLIPKVKATKAKISKWDYIKFKSFCTAKDTINKRKSQTTEWGKMSTDPKYIRNSQQNNNPIKN